MGGADGRPGGWVELTIPAAVARAASEFGDTAALAGPLAGAARVSYRELGERVTAVAGALIEAGVEPGDRVALWAPNGCEWVLIALGAPRPAAPSGVPAPANPPGPRPRPSPPASAPPARARPGWSPRPPPRPRARRAGPPRGSRRPRTAPACRCG